MAGATANSMPGGCDKAAVNYSNINNKNPLEDINYSSRVKGMMSNNEKDPFHAFPEAVDAFGDAAKESIIVGGDGIPRIKYELDGWYRGKEGTFEYIIESDKTSNHRLFRPK